MLSYDQRILQLVVLILMKIVVQRISLILISSLLHKILASSNLILVDSRTE